MPFQVCLTTTVLVPPNNDKFSFRQIGKMAGITCKFQLFVILGMYASLGLEVLKRSEILFIFFSLMVE